jgi:hypothetical protein
MAAAPKVTLLDSFEFMPIIGAPPEDVATPAEAKPRAASPDPPGAAEVSAGDAPDPPAAPRLAPPEGPEASPDAFAFAAAPRWSARTPEPAAPASPPRATGAGEVIVVIDTGFSPFYDQSRRIGGYDFSGANDRWAGERTLFSHGSWVGQTATDLAPDARVVHLKVFPDGGGWASGADIEEALAWCVRATARHDIAAVNLSLGAGNATRETLTQLSDEFAALAERGVFSVVAAGNDRAAHPRGGVSVIAADPNAIAVSAVGAGGRYAGFSQRSAALTDIAAPGVAVPVETLAGDRLLVSGTSFAAPYVSGCAARLQEAAETLYGDGARLTEDAFLDILRESGQRVRGGRGPGAAIADADAAVAWLADHRADYADDLFV